MRTKNIIAGLLMLVSTISFAQTELWYFGGWPSGGSGLEFTGAGNSPVSNTTGNFAIYEAISVVGDGSGNPLFYTDGLKVYNSNHVQMANGGGLLGSQEGGGSVTGSSLNGVLTTFDPGNPNEYYILTVNDIQGNTNGLRWHHVDMNANGGLGEVTSKNNIILDAGTFPTAEMMTAASEPCSDTIWIVTHGSNNNNFYSFPITATGVQTGAMVTSSVGPVVSGDARRGSFSFNSDASQLAMASGAGGGAWIFNFNALSGVVSASTEGFNSDGQVSQTGHYGCEWSPDDRKVYFSGITGSNNIHYNLDRAADNRGFSIGLEVFDNVSNPSLMGTEDCGMIETGADGKLYIGRSINHTFLGVISSPDAADAASCGYNANGQAVVSAWYGLPQMHLPTSTAAGVNGNITENNASICDSTSAFSFNATPSGGTWSTNPAGLINATTGLFDPSAAFGVVGDGGVVQIIYGGNCIIPDTIYDTIRVCCPDNDPNLGNDTTICDDLTTTLDAGAGFASYQWIENGVIMIGQSGSTIAADSGTYIVNLLDADGCPGTDTIEIGNYQLPVVDLGPDTSYCAGDSFLLDAGVFVSHAWTPNSETSQTIMVTSAGTYGVTVTDGNGCTNTDDVVLTEWALPVPTITGNTIVCADSSTQITGVAGSAGSLAWSGITPFTNPLSVTTGGTYTLIETDGNGCIDSVDHVVTLEALPALELGGPYEFCHTQGSQLLDASTGAVGETYVWSDASTGSTLTATDSSLVSVIVTSANGCIAYDTAVVDTFTLPVVDLGPDTFYCATSSIDLDAGTFTSYAWTPNSEITPTITVSTAGIYSVTVTDGNGCTDVDSVTISESALPVPTITGNSVVCADSSTQITGVAGSAGSLAWSGITPFTNPLSVTTGGTYTLIETDGNGCIDSVDHVVTLEALPALELGGPYEFCHTQGSQILDASTGAVGETYVWSDASTGSTLTATDSSLISVIVTSANGCIAYDTAVVDTFTLPVVDLGPDTFYCAASSIVLDAGTFTSYAWTPNSEITPTITVSTAGTYGVTVTDGNGCTDTDDVIITENALPTVDLGPDTTICEADSITLDATHADAASYAWTPNSETTATIKVGSTAGTYEVTITDVDGCEFTTDRTISQEDLPIVDLGLNDTICDDLTKTLDAGAGVNQSYAWYLDGSLIGSETSQTLAADSGTYVVSVTTGLGCETRDTILVDNYQLPIVDLAGPHEYCELDSVQLDAGNATATYSWSPNSETTQTIWANSATTYTVTVTDTNGCINSGSSVVSENANPIVNIGANDSACVGLPIPLDATIPNGVTYVWSNGHNQATYSLVGPDTLSVIATDNKGCIGYDTLEIAALDSLEIQFGDTTLECENDIQPIDAGTFQGATYSWTLPNGSTDMNQLIVPDQGGWHIINVTDQYNCKGLDSIFVVIIPVPNIDLGPDTMFCSLGQDEYTIRMEFTQNITGTIDWNDGGDNNNSNDTLFSATYAPSTVIGQFIDDATGCIHRDSVELKEFCEPTEIILPNIFIPGGTDNPTFHPIGVTDGNYTEIINNIVWSDFQVFNRWGLKVYQSKDLLPRWDGMYENRPVATGTYFWIFKYKDSSLKEYTYNGFVQVVQTRD